MQIKQIQAHINNYDVGRSGHQIKYIVAHWIVGTLESADTTFKKPDRKASAHYGIGDNEIHQYVKETDTAWHASNLTVNRESIGIEHEGGWLLPDKVNRFKPTLETHLTSAKLVADICRRYSIPIDKDHVFPHKKFSNTQCPGLLDIDLIIREAKKFEGGDMDKKIIDQSDNWIALRTRYNLPESKDAVFSILDDVHKRSDMVDDKDRELEKKQGEIKALGETVDRLKGDLKTALDESTKQNQRLAELDRKLNEAGKEIEVLKKMQPVSDYTASQLILKGLLKLFGK